MWRKRVGIEFPVCSHNEVIDSLTRQTHAHGKGPFERVVVFDVPKGSDATTLSSRYAFDRVVPNNTAVFFRDARQRQALFLGVNTSGKDARCVRDFVKKGRPPRSVDLGDIESALSAVQMVEDGHLRSREYERGLVLLAAAFVALEEDTTPLVRYVVSMHEAPADALRWKKKIQHTLRCLQRALQGTVFEATFPCELSRVVMKNAVCHILTLRR